MTLVATPTHWYQLSSGVLTTTTAETTLRVNANESAGWRVPIEQPVPLAAVVLVRALWSLTGPQNGVNAYLRLTSGTLADGSAWSATLPSAFASDVSSVSFTFTDAFRAAWNAISRGTIGAAELRLVDTNGSSRTFANVSIEYVLARQVYSAAALAVLGGDTAQLTAWEDQTSGGVIVGGRSRSDSVFAAGANLVEVGGATKQGLIYATSGRVAVGGDTAVRVSWRSQGNAAIGGATLQSNRFLVPLLLKSGQVVRDVGYMWVPVYLQLPDGVSDRPWEFFYPDGTPIPHLIRNTVGGQVRALVYMRPSVSVAQEFFCRIG